MRGVEVVGDVMFDVLRHAEPRLDDHARHLLADLGVARGEYVLATIHRPANTDDADAMRRIAAAFGALDLPVVFPIHPRTRNLIERYGIAWGPLVRVIEPVGHMDLLALARASARVATDSGGVQKEAFLLGVPCVTLREETEWPETLEGGWNVLVGNRESAIVAAVQRPRPQALAHNPFGDGDAAGRIARLLSALSPAA